MEPYITGNKIVLRKFKKNTLNWDLTYRVMQLGFDKKKKKKNHNNLGHYQEKNLGPWDQLYDNLLP